MNSQKVDRSVTANNTDNRNSVRLSVIDEIKQDIVIAHTGVRASSH
ncbi:hypothetical protein BN1183_CH_01340 [Pantoea ananatis]|nr:hypothetical protein BN1183_CH_01340 [Pantoea ananatis]